MIATNNTPTMAITGATGFVGAHLVRHFSQKGYEVLAIGRQSNPPAKLTQYASWMKADITKHVPDIQADIVIHCAAHASDKGNFSTFNSVNLLGTTKVFQASPSKCKFIYISSASVYKYSDQAISEDFKMVDSEKFKYGLTKQTGETYLHVMADRNKNVTILRPRAIYGTHDRVLMPRILQLAKGKKVWLPGNLNYKASMTSIKNLIHAIELAIPSKKTYTIYNVADEEIYNLREVIETTLKSAYSDSLIFKEIPMKPLKLITKIIEKLGVPSRLSSQSLDYMSHDFVLDIKKIKTELGYSPTTNFHKELPSIEHWIKNTGIERVKNGDKSIPWLD